MNTDVQNSKSADISCSGNGGSVFPEEADNVSAERPHPKIENDWSKDGTEHLVGQEHPFRLEDLFEFLPNILVVCLDG